MKAWHFSETAYPYLPDPETFDSIRVTLPNRYADPRKAADLWHRYLDEWGTADELGLGIMLNEHHSTATCMDPCAPVIAGILARETKNSQILILGNPIANRKDPVRVAEEMAVVDVLSRGRLVVGLVRGVPYEISATNTMPVRMSERFWEAHDLMVKAWTSHDGPFNWQGRYFEHRQVNIWPRPYQQPHPPVWVTSLSTGSTPKIADHGYVAATFLLGRDGTRPVFDAYRARREELGQTTPDELLAYAALVHVGDTDEDGLAGAEKLMWYIRANKVPSHFSNPPGYLPVPARVGTWQGKRSPFAFSHMTLEELIDRGIVFAGNPDTVHEQLLRFYDDVGGFGHLLIMGQAGFLEHEETVRSMRLFAQEVYPRVQDLGVAASAGAV
jgi:alkanesulfonate monooxygenase SsuD/methylene tetrahydromethanopterin reductase-like flavin-dependent oxidoreductase (luciferase family)